MSLFKQDLPREWIVSLDLVDEAELLKNYRSPDPHERTG
jgi:hypothetical protein